MAYKKNILVDTHFFRPDQKFLNWIKEYANGRLIIDVGCGDGHITKALRKLGCRIIGIDPFLSADDMSRARMKDDVNLLPFCIEDHPVFFVGHGNKVLLLFARPCHSSFVANTLEMKDADTEALYITVPENLDKYDDLGSFKNKAVLLQHEGTSKDNEIVHSIK